MDIQKVGEHVFDHADPKAMPKLGSLDIELDWPESLQPNSIEDRRVEVNWNPRQGIAAE